MPYDGKKEGTALIAVVAMEAPPPPACVDCDWDDARLVRFYLLVWRQARLSGEQFADVLRHRTRDSRAIDPNAKGRALDMQKLRAIGWSLDEVYRKHGAQFMHADNAVAVAMALCPNSAAR